MNLRQELLQIKPGTPEPYLSQITSIITFLQFFSNIRVYASPEGYFTVEWSKEPFVILLQFIEEKAVLTVASDIVEEAVCLVLSPTTNLDDVSSFFDTVLKHAPAPAAKDGQ